MLETHTKDIIRSIDEDRVINFVKSCRVSSSEYSMFPGGTPTPYARCLAIFILHLFHAKEEINKYYSQLIHALYQDLHEVHKNTISESSLKETRYLQLLTFTMSALQVLGAIRPDMLKKYLPTIDPENLKAELSELGVFAGKEKTGNTAMFYAILLLFREAWLEDTDSSAIRTWIKMHLDSMNRFGFWGPDKYYKYSHFYNGYHQYEILEYLKLKPVYSDMTTKLVATLQDEDGHFAPSPGGGGCYDYDAVFLLTPDGHAAAGYEPILRKTAFAIKQTQNRDGGFCESAMLKPWRLKKVLSHISSARTVQIARQRAKTSFSLTQKRDHTIPAYIPWKKKSVAQSNLWDTWFRLMTLARIDHALHIISCRDWGFIDFPGIGYHPSLNARGGYYH